MVYKQTEKTRIRNEQRKRDIMDAARSLFVEKGYHSTTMNHIVKKASIGFQAPSPLSFGAKSFFK